MAACTRRWKPIQSLSPALTIALTLMAGAFTPAHAEDAAARPTIRRIVIAVGVDKVNTPSATPWVPLNAAALDAQDMFDTLHDRYAFTDSLSKRLYGEASQAGDSIRTALTDVHEAARANKGDLFELVFYMSSHGIAVEQAHVSHSYLITSDSPGQKPEPPKIPAPPMESETEKDKRNEWLQALSQNAISLDNLIDRLIAFPENVVRVAFILDACSTPGGKTGVVNKNDGATEATDAQRREELERQKKLLKAQRGRFVFSAVSPGEPAAIFPSDRNSLYTKYLLAALAGGLARIPEKLRIGSTMSLLTAHRFAAHQLQGSTQTPSYSAPGVTGSDAFFFLDANGPPASSWGPAAIALKVIDAFWKVIAKGESGSASTQPPKEVEDMFLVLPDEGRYTLEIRRRGDNGLELTIPITLSGDNRVYTLDVQSALYARPAHQLTVMGGWHSSHSLWGKPSGVAPGWAGSLRYSFNGPHAWYMPEAGRLDLAFGSQRPTGPTDVTVTELLANGAVEWPARWQTGPVFLSLGPEAVAGVLARTATNATPGLFVMWGVGAVAAADLPFSETWSIVAQARADLRTFNLSGQGQLFWNVTGGIHYRIPSRVTSGGSP